MAPLWQRTHPPAHALLQGSKTPSYTPATIFLVTDHLHHLLVKNMQRRDKASGTDEERFSRAVHRLHATIFQGYRDWCRHVYLPIRIKELQYETLLQYAPIVVRPGKIVFFGGWWWCRHMPDKRHPCYVGQCARLQQRTHAWTPFLPQDWEYLLEELALYFLVYSEAANLRHMPEALWFLFWVMRNSRTTMNQCTAVPVNDPKGRSAAQAGEQGQCKGYPIAILHDMVFFLPLPTFASSPPIEPVTPQPPPSL